MSLLAESNRRNPHFDAMVKKIGFARRSRLGAAVSGQ